MVRPIDLQDNLSKAPLASRLQQVQQSAPEMAHRQTGQVLAQQQIVDRSRPLPAPEAERPEVHPEGGRRQTLNRRRRRRPLPEAAPAAPPEEGDLSHLDIVA